MAPKKGGGSSSGSSVSLPGCDYCTVITELRGFNLRRYPQEAAGVAFAGIVLAGFLALFIASVVAGGTLLLPNKRRATKFGLSWALCFFVISQALTLADSVLHDTNTKVMRVYYITIPISDAFYFGADTIIPWTILCFIWIRLRALYADRGFVKVIRGTAIGFLSLLTALFVAIIAIDITLSVSLNDYSYSDDDVLGLAYSALWITHVTVRALIAIIAVGFSVKLYSESRFSNTRSKIPILILAMVTPWFLLREIISLAFAVTSYRRAYYGDVAAYNLARQLSYGVVSMIIYAGLVLCMYRPEWRYVEVQPHVKQNENSTEWAPGISVA